jgi:hypothetical protein
MMKVNLKIVEQKNLLTKLICLSWTNLKAVLSVLLFPEGQDGRERLTVAVHGWWMAYAHMLCCCVIAQPLTDMAHFCLCRAEQAVPPVLAPFCHGLGLLHDLRKCVHYNEENCVALLRRFVAAQTLLLELKELKPQHLVLVQLLSDIMRDAYHLFQQFSER